MCILKSMYVGQKIMCTAAPLLPQYDFLRSNKSPHSAESECPHPLSNLTTSTN